MEARTTPTARSACTRLRAWAPALALALPSCAAPRDGAWALAGIGALALAAALVLLLVPLRWRGRNEAAMWRDAERIAELSRAAGLGELSAWSDEELGRPIASLLNNVGAAHRLLERGQAALPEASAAVDEARVVGEQVAHAIRRMRLAMGAPGARQGPVHLNDLAREVVRLIQWQAKAHGVALQVGLQAGLPPVRGDRDALFQMALGLVLAAVDAAAAAPARSVEVRTALADGWVELTVADSGRAITEADRPQLFAPFSPLRRGGLGIGLFVARSIAEAHGGHVTAERPPAGALFRVVLPAQVSTGVAEPAPEAVRPSA